MKSPILASSSPGVPSGWIRPRAARSRGHLPVGGTQGGQHLSRAHDEGRVDVGGFQFRDGPPERGDGLIDPAAAGLHNGQVELRAGPS